VTRDLAFQQLLAIARVEAWSVRLPSVAALTPALEQALCADRELIANIGAELPADGEPPAQTLSGLSA
jgi:hypothetical protein